MFGILLCFLLAFVLNSLTLFGETPIFTFLLGLAVLVLLFIDYLKCAYHFSIYQVLLLYFYFTLVLSHNFNADASFGSGYYMAYMINGVHFLCLALGYNLVVYKSSAAKKSSRQNMLALFFLLVPFIGAVIGIFSSSSDPGRAYHLQFLSKEQVMDLPIFTMVLSDISSTVTAIAIKFISNPLVYNIIQFSNSSITYLTSGIKAPVVWSAILLLVSFQYIYKKFSSRQVIVLSSMGLAFMMFLIGSTAFREELGFASFLKTVTDFEKMFSYWKYFFRSPESSHIVYTKNLIDMIESGETSFRYGFDFFRIYLYPFKSLFPSFEFSSYNQFPLLIKGDANQGLYLGLAGELFWNFGPFFWVFSVLHGVALKKFTNWGFSGKWLPFLMYCHLYGIVLWHFYRGQINALNIYLIGFLFSYLGVLALIALFSTSEMRYLNIRLFRIRTTFSRKET